MKESVGLHAPVGCFQIPLGVKNHRHHLRNLHGRQMRKLLRVCKLHKQQEKEEGGDFIYFLVFSTFLLSRQRYAFFYKDLGWSKIWVSLIFYYFCQNVSNN